MDLSSELKKMNIENIRATFKRRELLDWIIFSLLIVSGALIFIPILKFLFPPSRVMEGAGGKIAIADLKDIPPGKSKSVVYKGASIILIHSYAGNIVALSGICTHKGCFLKWNEIKNQIECPCHNGIFSINGSVLSGPPPKPLKSFNIEFSNGKIYIGAN